MSVDKDTFHEKKSSDLVEDAWAAVSRDGDVAVIDADRRGPDGRPMHYRTLNALMRQLMLDEVKKIVVEGVMGQRYIASNASRKDLVIEIHGTPGNDLGAFLDGPTIEVFGNAQDLTGNTMNSGRIIIHGSAWDVTGLAARGGTIFIRDNTGYRVGIHMKEYCGRRPTIVVGGTAKDYLGEYMAGGIIVILNLNHELDTSPIGLNIGAGIHGGKIYLRGKVDEHQLGSGAIASPIADEDIPELEGLINDFEAAFDVPVPRNWLEFMKIYPSSSRPFSGHYDPTCI